MKKINSIQQLNAEKVRIAERQKDLEDKIGDNWKELKAAFTPANMARDLLSSIVAGKATENHENEHMLKNALKYMLSLWAAKVADKSG